MRDENLAIQRKKKSTYKYEENIFGFYIFLCFQIIPRKYQGLWNASEQTYLNPVLCDFLLVFHFSLFLWICFRLAIDVKEICQNQISLYSLNSVKYLIMLSLILSQQPTWWNPVDRLYLQSIMTLFLILVI